MRTDDFLKLGKSLYSRLESSRMVDISLNFWYTMSLTLLSLCDLKLSTLLIILNTTLKLTSSLKKPISITTSLHYGRNMMVAVSKAISTSFLRSLLNLTRFCKYSFSYAIRLRTNQFKNHRPGLEWNLALLHLQVRELLPWIAEGIF